jgi:hypothetical protein
MRTITRLAGPSINRMANAPTCRHERPASATVSGRAGRSTAGMTFIETMVYSILFLIVAGFILQLLWGSRHADAGRKRLGIFQDLRLSSARINQALSHSTRILFPPADGKSYSQIVFLSDRGELMVIYLNDQDMLYLLNYDGVKERQAQPTLLARRALEFTAMRPPGSEDYVQYLARVLDEKGVEFCLSDGIMVRNLIQ